MTTRISYGSLRKITRNLLFPQIACFFIRTFQASNLSVIIVIDLYGSIEDYLSVLPGASDFTPFSDFALIYQVADMFHTLSLVDRKKYATYDASAASLERYAYSCDGGQDKFVIRTQSNSPRRIKFHTRRQLIPCTFTSYQVRNIHGLTFLSGISMNPVLPVNSGATFGASYNNLAAGFLQCRLIR